MSIQDGSIDFPLSRPIKYKFDNATHEATHVILQEPGMEHCQFCDKIEQMITKAQMDYTEKIGIQQSEAGEVVKPFHEQVKEEEVNTEELAEALAVVLKDSNRVDYSKFNATFAKMACVINPKKSICLIDGRLAMNSTLWANLCPKDAKAIALRWAAFFVMPSEEGEKTSSEEQSESPTEPKAA
jgi:hypothetical protein